MDPLQGIYKNLPDNSGGLEPLPIKLEFIIYPSRL